MRTETLAIVFTDIKGYTATTAKQSHEENAKLLKKAETVITPVVSSFDGRIIKSIGDAYMVVFRSPTEAVRCATAIQDKLFLANRNFAEDDQLHIRVAINVGEVRVQGGDVFGEPVNIAARVESVTPADEIYLSQAVYLTMNRSEIPCEHVGEFELKGITEPVTIYRVEKKNRDSKESAQDITISEASSTEAPPEDGEAPPEDGEAPKEGETSISFADLPYGGGELAYLRRTTITRRGIYALWGLSALVIALGTWLRFQPDTDYVQSLESIQKAIKEERPTEALALANQIPETTQGAFILARRYKHRAIRQLIESGSNKDARVEVDRLLAHDDRDSVALMYRGLLRLENKDEESLSIDDFAKALKLDPELREQQALVRGVVQCYLDKASRPKADVLIEEVLGSRAKNEMLRVLYEKRGDRLVQRWIAERLKKMGVGGDVDWVHVRISELEATSCRVRKEAIAALIREADERAIGPLMRLSKENTCGSKNAKRAIELIIK